MAHFPKTLKYCLSSIEPHIWVSFRIRGAEIGIFSFTEIKEKAFVLMQGSVSPDQKHFIGYQLKIVASYVFSGKEICSFKTVNGNVFYFVSKV